ncbi:hypothetical protein [Vibrio aerogenes]|nr:hypothetical protein [Vibrio aerogenes]
MIGYLKWGDAQFEIVTGGYGKGAIPDGVYKIEKRRIAAGNKSNMESGYINPLTGKGFFIPLKPGFSTHRHGFGIHPDGNLPGTLGCLGLQGADTKKFWDKWIKTPMRLRPDTLIVSTKIEE